MLGKYWPYKLVCIFLYGDAPGVIPMGEQYFSIQLPEFCGWTKVQSSRMRVYLQECERLGMIEDLRLARGLATFRICRPPNLTNT